MKWTDDLGHGLIKHHVDFTGKENTDQERVVIEQCFDAGGARSCLECFSVAVGSHRKVLKEFQTTSPFYKLLT